MRVLLLEQAGEKTLAQVKNIDSDQLPEGDVTVDVNWSSLNYKDALAITGTGKLFVTSQWCQVSILPAWYTAAKIRVLSQARA